MSVQADVEQWKATLARLIVNLETAVYDYAMTKAEARSENISYTIDSSDRDTAEQAIHKHLNKLVVNNQHFIEIQD